MNLIDEQIVGLNQLNNMPKSKILIIIVGNDCYNALKSIQKQLYTNFNIICIKDNPLQYLEGLVQIEELPNTNILKSISLTLETADAEYIYLLDGNDELTANALLEYAKCIEERNCPDIIYANEVIQYDPTSKWLTYRIKPRPSYIAFFQSFFIGTAVIWKREMLKSILKNAVHEPLDLLSKELFMYALLENAQVIQIPKFLLKRSKNGRLINHDNYIFSLLQRNINMHTEWEGHVGRTSSYGLDSFELYSGQIESLPKAAFVIIEDDFNRTLQLLSQLNISCNKNEIVVGVWKDHQEKIFAYCSKARFSNIHIMIRKESYTETLIGLIEIIQSPYHIIMNDLVQWINSLNLERLIKCFFKPEVMVAVPQVATEGEDPILVYAGAGINTLSLNRSYFFGRSQKTQGDQDLAWINYEASMLTPYCIALRKEVWDDLLPLHHTVNTARHLANEISFLCIKKGIICEYCAQSSVWVSEIVENYNRKNPKTGEIILGNIDQEPRMSGNYWHLLADYGDLIEEKRGNIPYLLRSHEKHMKEDFQAFGLNNILKSHSKRVLVLTHELSLTGAPLVLVQAVKVLTQSNFGVVVASPEDGPLRETYLQMKVPVIIDPLLQYDFEYIKYAYDFNFVIVSTVVLWQCIEAFSKTSLPVLWWVHDSRIGYENYLRYVMPKTIGENILLYCGGDYAQKVISEFRPLYSSSILLYGVEDFSKDTSKTVDRNYWGLPDGKIIFANVGQIIRRKGQDILVKAIRLLPAETVEKCVFVFVGTIVDRSIFKDIDLLQKEYPRNIVHIKQMPYNLLKEFYREIDGVICSSIDDPLPAFVSEALLMSKLCICSSNTAFNSIITSGTNGYIFESGNSEELSSVICQVVNKEEYCQQIKQNARRLYEETFTPKIFAQNLTHIIQERLMNQ